MIGLTEISQKSDIFRKNMCQVSDINFTVIYQKLGQNIRKKCQKKISVKYISSYMAMEHGGDYRLHFLQ